MVDPLEDFNVVHAIEETLKRAPTIWHQYCNILGTLCGGIREDDGGMFVSFKETIGASIRYRYRAIFRLLSGLPAGPVKV